MILNQELAFFDTVKTFEYASKFQTELKTIENGLGEKTGNIFAASVCSILGFGLGFWSNWKMTLILIAYLPVIGITAVCGFCKIEKCTEESLKYYSEAGDIAEELITHIKTAFSHGNFDWERNRYQMKIELAYAKTKKGGVLSAVLFGLFFCSIFGCFGLGF